MIFTLARETLVEHLLQVPGLVSRYQEADPSFVPATLGWMLALERDLVQLRLPIAGLCAAERGKALAALAGCDEVTAPQPATRERKGTWTGLVLCVGRIEAAVREAVSAFDTKLMTAADKLAQLLAVSSSVTELELPEAGLSPTDARALWTRLGKGSEGRGLHRYLSASLSATDRETLLRRVLESGLAHS